MSKPRVLKNGLRLFTVPYAGTQAVTVLVMCKIGSRYETEAEGGISHFIEHLFFKGTDRRPTPLEISRTLDAVGADYNAFTGKEYTGYYIKVDARHGELAADLLEDMVFHSKCDEAELNRERHVILEEIKMYNDRPSSKAHHLFEELMYGSHPLGRDIAGTPETMLAMSRDMVLDYRARAYRPDRMVVVVAGKIDETLTERLETLFGNVEAPAHPWQIQAYTTEQTVARIALEDRKIEQVQLVVGFPTFGVTDARKSALDILATILGGTMSSRLFISIREQKGLAYAIRAGASYYEDTGAFEITSGLNRDKVALAYQTILEELALVRKDGITDEELSIAKEHIRGQLLLSLEDSFNQAEWYANESLFFADVKTPDERLAELEAVTKDEVNTLAQQIFDPEKRVVSAVGPLGTKEDFLKEIGW